MMKNPLISFKHIKSKIVIQMEEGMHKDKVNSVSHFILTFGWVPANWIPVSTSNRMLRVVTKERHNVPSSLDEEDLAP